MIPMLPHFSIRFDTSQAQVIIRAKTCAVTKRKQSIMNQRTSNSNQSAHAVVIGGSIAGLLTARVLANHFPRVTIIERDQLPEAPAFRKGAPQARHAHGLLALGQQIMEGYFPGFTKGLLANGATVTNMGSDVALYVGGKWMQPFTSAVEGIGCSRALIEHQLHQQLRSYPQVTYLQGHTVEGLYTDETNSHVAGLHLRNRQQPNAKKQRAGQKLAATLVVDASGRTSALPEWLAELGFTPPTEITVDAKAGYATRVYRMPANAPSWKMMYYLAAAPNQSRGGIIIPTEGTAGKSDRWLVTLVGLNGDYPPTDEAGFLDFARSLPSPELYQAIQEAEPLTEPYGYQRAANRLRHYDQLPCYLEGVLAIGDAVYALNPVYGQGMTVAALGAKTLDRVLQQHKKRHDRKSVTGLAATFQQQLANVIAGPWQLATGQDLRWPVAANGHKIDPFSRFLQGYVNRVIDTLAENRVVAEAFVQVQNMLKSPPSLFHPQILWRVWRAGRMATERAFVTENQQRMTTAQVHETLSNL